MEGGRVEIHMSMLIGLYLNIIYSIHRYRELNSVYRWGEGTGKGNIGGEDQEIQTIRNKISYKDIQHGEYSQ